MKKGSPIRRVIVEGLARLPAFCHATVADNLIFVSGTLGTREGMLELVQGGTGPETTQTLRNIQLILGACGATFEDILKVNVYLRDLAAFQEMNEAYLGVMGTAVPARITVGRADLALGAAVEIDCIARKP